MKIPILMLNAGRGSGEVARHQMRYLADEGHAVSLLVPGEVEPTHGVDHREVLLHDTTLPVHEYLIEGAAGTLVTTEYVRDELVRPLVDLPEDKFLVLPCAIDLDEFSGGPDREVLAKYDIQEPFVLCPGALTEVKGPQNVLDASREYADLALTVFIGDGEMRQSLETELAGRGRFLGFVPAADKAALIRSATLLTAAPQKREHFGIIYAEALAAGTPPVAYEGGGVPSVVTPQVGLLTRRDPRSLGKGIRELLLDPDRREAMSAAGRRRAEQCFHPQTLGVALEGWLRRMAAGA